MHEINPLSFVRQTWHIIQYLHRKDLNDITPLNPACANTFWIRFVAFVQSLSWQMIVFNDKTAGTKGVDFAAPRGVAPPSASFGSCGPVVVRMFFSAINMPSDGAPA